MDDGIELPEGWEDWPEADKVALYEYLLYTWELHARPDQLMPDGDWTYLIYLAGRGWGKTRTGAEHVKKWALEQPGCQIAVLAPTHQDVKNVAFNGVSGIISVIPPSMISRYNSIDLRIELTNGSAIQGFTGEKPDRLRGPQHHRAWVDELCAMRMAEEAWSQLMFGLRLPIKGDHPRAVVTTTPRPTPLLRELIGRAESVVVRGKTLDNVDNLSDAAVAELISKYGGTHLGRQELDGEIVDSVPGALWDMAMIELTRIKPEDKPRSFQRAVVAVDPAVSSGPESDETGISVVALGWDLHLYVLEDLSGTYTPDEWAKIAVRVARRYACPILVERNNGGAAWKTIIRHEDETIEVLERWAKGSKEQRANPVKQLWEGDAPRAHLVGDFPDLEKQMTGWEPLVSRWSPDRLDAMVWGCTELDPRPPSKSTSPRKAVEQAMSNTRNTSRLAIVKRRGRGGNLWLPGRGPGQPWNR